MQRNLRLVGVKGRQAAGSGEGVLTIINHKRLVGVKKGLFGSCRRSGGASPSSLTPPHIQV